MHTSERMRKKTFIFSVVAQIAEAVIQTFFFRQMKG